LAGGGCGFGGGGGGSAGSGGAQLGSGAGGGGGGGSSAGCAEAIELAVIKAARRVVRIVARRTHVQRVDRRIAWP
jgi:hypothetical protein